MELSEYFSFKLKPRPPYNVTLTIKKPAGWDLFTPEEMMEGDSLYTALYVGSVPVGLRIYGNTNARDPVLKIVAYTQKRADSRLRREIKESLAFRLNVNGDLSEFYRFASKDSILRHAVKDLYGMHDTIMANLFSACILGVCLQMAPLKRSQQMMENILTNYGKTLKFCNKTMRLWPLPSDIRKIATSTLAKKCKLGYRAKFITGISRVLSKGDFPPVEIISQMTGEEAKKKVMELPGIGDYASDIVLPHGGFPIDAWSVEVFGELFFGKKPSENRSAIERVKNAGIKRFGGWSWMAFFYVVNDLGNLSKKLGVNLRLE